MKGVKPAGWLPRTYSAVAASKNSATVGVTVVSEPVNVSPFGTGCAAGGESSPAILSISRNAANNSWTSGAGLIGVGVVPEAVVIPTSPNTANAMRAGRAKIVAIGDTAAVSELADTITLSALAQAGGETELAEQVWLAGGRAVGWGSTPAHRRAKELARSGSPEALAAMRTSAEGDVAAT